MPHALLAESHRRAAGAAGQQHQLSHHTDAARGLAAQQTLPAHLRVHADELDRGASVRVVHCGRAQAHKIEHVRPGGGVVPALLEDASQLYEIVVAGESSQLGRHVEY